MEVEVMYSVILMAAVSAGGQAPAGFFHHGGDCYGGGRGAYLDCHGGYSCYGACYGWYADYSSTHGGGYDSSAYDGGGFGSCRGLSYGGGDGGDCYGGAYWGCCGYGINGYATYGCHGCYGCYGCYGCTGYAPSLTPGVAPGGYYPALPTTAPGGGSDVLPPPKKEGTSRAPTRARLVVELPADAQLYVDDRRTQATSERRTFQTPELEKGQAYYYEVRVEAVRDGKPVSETRRVVVKAGEEVLADFKDVGASTAKSK
jgi:uncharacterized protein (TIGR03000 family)